MFDLHTHSIFSDGELIPAESARRACNVGYKGIAITDNGETSNLVWILERQLYFKEAFNKLSLNFKIIIGVELTHVLPEEIEKLTLKARESGADIVLVHGETIVEPVAKGTNRAAIDACVDILAHPGLISDEDAKLAASNSVSLEISTRNGHSYTNAHVTLKAREFGAKLVVNNDFHSPGDNLSIELIRKVLKGAGLKES
jgi:histidinol phosphatase-like PHP family hydrolase